MAEKVKKSVLRTIPMFSSLDDEHLQKLSVISKMKSYKKHEVVFNEGDEGNFLFVILSGSVKVMLADSEGKETILRVLYKDDYFGEMSLLDGRYRSATVTTLEDSDALMLYREDFIRLMIEHPESVLAIIADLSRRMRATNEKIASLAFHDSYGKVAKLLIDLIKQKGSRVGDTVVLEGLPVSRKEMASIAGVARETLNRILHEFEIRGCIALEKRKITVLNEGILLKEVM